MDNKEQKEFLEEQLQWTKEQILILDEMDMKLQEMRKIAEYAAKYELPADEIEKLNRQIKELQNEYSFLEAQRKTEIH
ncbi:hypothetical protein [Planococcus sp. CAU13]|uniref:hypothetical protein n=1 Tax=Planococcus sp. CAU13 TaxID=1541197 RepID=UPI0005300119|nr:hypothetical protein [Planococcus sp. CAU13]